VRLSINEVEQHYKDKFLRNTAFSIGGHLWRIVFGLITTPIIISYIGIERFGIWAMIGLLAGYFGLADFGMGSAFVRFITNHHANDELEKINTIASTAVFFFVSTALCLMAVTVLILNPLIHFLGIGKSLESEAAFVFLFGLATLFMNNIFSIFYSIQIGLQRMDITNKVSIAMTVPSLAGTLLVLKLGYGLRGLIVNHFAMTVIFVAVNMLIARRLLPSLRVRPTLFRFGALKELITFGLKIQIGNLSEFVTFQIDKMLIGHFLNLNLVGQFQIGTQVAAKARQIPSMLAFAVMPAAAELDARGDKGKLDRMYISGSKFLSLITAPLMGFLFIFAGVIVTAWINDRELVMASLAIRMLAPALMFYSIAVVATSVAVGIGQPGIVTRAGLSYIILNIILSIILIMRFGYPGTLAATTIPMWLYCAMLWIKLHRHLDVSSTRFFFDVLLKPASASFIAGAILFFPSKSIGLFSMFNTRLHNIAILTGGAALFFLLYILLIRRMNFLDKYERNILSEKLGLPDWTVNLLLGK